jgi:curli biogenesis system outer membrane secretion channel CsgG
MNLRTIPASRRDAALLLLLLLLLLISTMACGPAFAWGRRNASEPGGAAAGASSQNAATTLEHCAAPMGTLSVVEDQQGDWFRTLTADLRLPSTVPLMRLLIQQSNCFVVVERGRAMGNLFQERALDRSGEIRKGSGFGKGQLVAADYSLNPSINFSSSDAGGIAGILGAFGGRAAIAGALVGGLKFKKSETILALVDNRSGVQVAMAQGQGRRTSFGLGGLGGAGGIGVWSETPEGKVISLAFADAYNNLVRSLRDYKAQTVQGGLGKGGRLDVAQ